MNTLFENVKSILQKKIPIKYKKEIEELQDPSKLIMYLNHSANSTIGNYVLDGKNNLITLNSYRSNQNSNNLLKLPNSFTFEEFNKLIETNIITVSGIRGIYSLSAKN